MELEVEVISFPVAQILICSHDLCEVTKRVREPLFFSCTSGVILSIGQGTQAAIICELKTVFSKSVRQTFLSGIMFVTVCMHKQL